MTTGALDTSLTVINNMLVVALNSDMNDEHLESINHHVTTRINEFNLKGVLLDFSLVEVINSYSHNLYKKISLSVTLMGADVIWVGLKPGVVIALIDLDLMNEMMGIRTASNIDDGIAVLTGERTYEE